MARAVIPVTVMHYQKISLIHVPIWLLALLVNQTLKLAVGNVFLQV